MDPKLSVSDRKIASEPASTVDLKHTISDSKIDSKSASVLDSNQTDEIELCNIVFKDNKSTTIPKDMIGRYHLLKVQEPKDNIYYLNSLDIKVFMSMFYRLNIPSPYMIN
jgi:hypothetical protein